MQQNTEDAMTSSYNDLLILDAGSTHNMSCNKSFVYDIKKNQAVDIYALTQDQSELRKKLNFLELRKQ